jgi:hypothetical protein
MAPPPLPKNPQLPGNPLGVYTDAQFAADDAALRASTQRDYGDVLQQLGYTDENGNYIPGLVEIGADRQRTDLNRSLGLAAEGVTRQAQRQGTLFSGRRGEETGRAEHPYRTGLAQLEEDLPRQLGTLYEHATNILSNYTTGRNQLLAAAAGRYVPAPVDATAGAAGAADVGSAAEPVDTSQGTGTGAPSDPLHTAYEIAPHGTTPLKTAFASTPRKRYAQGGIAGMYGEEDATLGEEGPEAVVPLDGSLEQLAQLRAAIERLMGGDRSAFPVPPHGAQPPPRQAMPATPPDQRGQRQATPSIPNPTAKALKAAGSLFSELAKHHEHEAQPAGHQGRNQQPPMGRHAQPVRRPRPRPRPPTGPAPYEGGLTRNDLLRFAGR